MRTINYFFLIPIIIILLSNGVFNMNDESNISENRTGFYKDSLEVVVIFENCIRDQRTLLRSEINKINNYLNKHEKVDSPVIEHINRLFLDFIYMSRLYKTMTEDEQEKFWDYSDKYLKETKRELDLLEK